MPREIDPLQARRAQLGLYRSLGAVAVFLALIWVLLSLAVEEPVALGDMALAIEELTRAQLLFLAAVGVAVGLWWAWTLSNGAIALWGYGWGIAATVAVLTIQRAFSFATLAFAAYLLWRLRRAAATASASMRPPPLPGSPERARTSSSDLAPTVFSAALFAVPVLCGLFSAAMLWTQDPTAEWHWAVKIPASVVAGGVTHTISNFALAAALGAIARGR